MPNLSVESLSLFLVFVAPGFVALKVYDLLIPSPRRNAGQAVIDIITYSMINLGLMSWFLFVLNSGDFATTHPYWYLTLHLPMILISPALLAYSWFRLQKLSFVRGWTLSPIPTGWDKAFESRRQYWIVFHLKNGAKIGGFFGENSLASSFPTESDIFIEEVWQLDDKHRFARKTKGTAGMLIRRSDCDLIELFYGDTKL